MNPCAICGNHHGGAPEGSRYCRHCDSLVRPFRSRIASLPTVKPKETPVEKAALAAVKGLVAIDRRRRAIQKAVTR